MNRTTDPSPNGRTRANRAFLTGNSSGKSPFIRRREYSGKIEIERERWRLERQFMEPSVIIKGLNNERWDSAMEFCKSRYSTVLARTALT